MTPNLKDSSEILTRHTSHGALAASKVRDTSNKCHSKRRLNANARILMAEFSSQSCLVSYSSCLVVIPFKIIGILRWKEFTEISSYTDAREEKGDSGHSCNIIHSSGRVENRTVINYFINTSSSMQSSGLPYADLIR